jgi:hypothetical protein
MTEHEMEDLIAAHPKEFFPRKEMVPKGRQESFSGVGRFDLLFEDEHRTNVLMELKARPAKYEDASQLAKYKTALEQRGERNVLMWLVAPLIPRPVREFPDSIGIEYTEIHEAEYRVVALRHNITFESESRKTTSSTSIIAARVEAPTVEPDKQNQQRWSFGRTEKPSGNASDFLARCDDSAKAFFSAFFDHQKTLTRKTQITWNHQSGFSMQFYFRRLGYVEVIWGFPAVNRKGATSRNKQSLVFPFDFAVKRGVPEDFLNGFGQALAEGVILSGGSKRPSIPVSHLSQAEVEHILSTVSSYVEKASSV